MFSKRNFGLTNSIIETSKKVSEDYQEKVRGLMAKMGIKSLKDLSPEEKKKFFNKLDTMHKAKHEEVELDEAVLRGRDFKYDEKRSRVLITKQNFKKAGKDSTSMSGGIPKMMVLSKKGGTVLAPVEFTDQKKINAFKEEVEQVDEISKNLAKSYAKKSMKDIVKKQHSTGTVNTSKRFAGLDRAKKRIVKDDLDLEKMAGELDGASKMHKGQSDRIKKHLKKMDSAKTKSERTLTPGEEDKKEKIVMSLKDKAADFEKRYPGKGKQVMYAVATKMAKKD